MRNTKHEALLFDYSRLCTPELKSKSHDIGKDTKANPKWRVISTDSPTPDALMHAFSNRKSGNETPTRSQHVRRQSSTIQCWFVC